MGLTTTESKATLDARFPTTGGTDYIGYSADGTTESTAVARHAVGATGWAAATTADPSVKSNAAALASPAVTATATITHAAVFTASTGGTQRTDWQRITDAGTPKDLVLAVGDTITWGIGKFQIRLT